jgi:hypothetical protein
MTNCFDTTANSTTLFGVSTSQTVNICISDDCIKITKYNISNYTTSIAKKTICALKKKYPYLSNDEILCML